jgi:hypothetical protein
MGSLRGASAPLKKLLSPFPFLRGRGIKGDRVLIKLIIKTRGKADG